MDPKRDFKMDAGPFHFLLDKKEGEIAANAFAKGLYVLTSIEIQVLKKDKMVPNEMPNA